MFVLAHFSDPHLAPLPAPRFSDLASKRLFGFLNWQRKRRDIHRPIALETVLVDLKAQAPDHIALTGDLVNIALAEEFTAARAWLRHVGDPKDVTLVAGNHDAYVRAMVHEPEQQWGEYMVGDSLPTDPATRFPFVRRRGPVALVGVSSAIATPPFRATGRVGKPQLSRLVDALRALGGEGMFRIVMIHHPPVEGAHHHSERLINSEPLQEVLAEHGAELLIHGHDHVHTVSWLDGPNGRIPAVGVPSASAAAGGSWEPAGYNLYRIDGGPGAWRCELEPRGFSADGTHIVDLGRRTLRRPH